MADNIGKIETGVPVSGTLTRIKAYGPIKKGDFVGRIPDFVVTDGVYTQNDIMYIHETTNYVTMVSRQGYSTTYVQYVVYRRGKHTLTKSSGNILINGSIDNDFIVHEVSSNKIIITTNNYSALVEFNSLGVPTVRSKVTHSLPNVYLIGSYYKNNMLAVVIGPSASIYSSYKCSTYVYTVGSTRLTLKSSSVDTLYGSSYFSDTVPGCNPYPIITNDNRIVFVSVAAAKNTTEQYLLVAIYDAATLTRIASNKILLNSIPGAGRDDGLYWSISNNEFNVVEIDNNTYGILYTINATNSNGIMGIASFSITGNTVTLNKQYTMKTYDPSSSGIKTMHFEKINKSSGHMLYKDGAVYVGFSRLSNQTMYKIQNQSVENVLNRYIHKIAEGAGPIYNSIQSGSNAIYTGPALYANDGRSFAASNFSYTADHTEKSGILLGWVVNDNFLVPVGVAMSDLGSTFGEIDVLAYDDNTNKL